MSRLEKFRVPLALALFACCLWLYTRHHDFPFFYHPDEPDKARQIIENRWNFHHPALMLAAAKAVVAASRGPFDLQHVTLVGRWLSAIYAAVAVVALALLAWRRHGFVAFAAVALLAGLHHQIFELAHYFKEDTALLMGVALTFLALDFFCKSRTGLAAALLGGACAISLSAKYLGAVMLLPAILALTISPREKRAAHLALFAFVLFGVTALANYPLLANWPQFRESFGREFMLATKGASAVSHSLPNTEYFPILADNLNPALWLFLACFVWRTWRERARHDFMARLLALFPFVYMALLMGGSRSNDRYFLPATALFAFIAALGMIEAARLVSTKIGARAAVVSVSVFAAGCQLFGFVKYDLAFAHDDRAELADWIRAHLPASAALAQDARVSLPTAARAERLPWQTALPQRVTGVEMDADTMAELRAEGVTHVVASESNYGRYYRRAGKTRAADLEKAEKRRAFYDELFRRGEKLWSRPRGTVIYLHPGLELYRLPPG